MYNRDMEIREAIDAGERALRSLREAKSSLDSARGWGIVDMMVQSKIRKAQDQIDDAIDRVETLLGRLRRY